MHSDAPPCVVIVDGDEGRAESVGRILRDFSRVEIALSIAGVVNLVDSLAPSGLVTAIQLPDGDGFDAIGQVREKFAAIPALLLLVGVDVAARAQARELGVLVECFPVDVESLSPFVCSALAFAFAGDSEMAKKMSKLGTAAALKPGE